MNTGTEDLVRERLYEDEYVVCASAKHPLARQKSVTVADIARERWAPSEPVLLAPHRLFEKFREHGLASPRIAFQSRSPEVRLRVVASSDGAALQPGGTVSLVWPSLFGSVTCSCAKTVFRDVTWNWLGPLFRTS